MHSVNNSICYSLLCRLPVGHTHEDIDGCFGVLAIWFNHTIIQTPQGYKVAVEECFTDSKLNIHVEDVFVIPDYKKFFGPHIDEHFGRIHKLQWTQLQVLIF